MKSKASPPISKVTEIIPDMPYKALDAVFTNEESNVKIFNGDDYKLANLKSYKEFASNNEWIEWCGFLEKYNYIIDDFEQSIQTISNIPNLSFFSEKFNSLLKEKIIEIIENYQLARLENLSLAPLSKEALNGFLLIIPILSCYSYSSIHIDSTNGNINIDIAQNSKGILNLQIASNKLIYFSYVGENLRIFKITGTFKLKNNFDLVELNRIFNLL